MQSKFAILWFLCFALAKIAAKPAHSEREPHSLQASKAHQLHSYLVAPPGKSLWAEPLHGAKNCSLSITVSIVKVLYNSAVFGFTEYKDFRSLVSECQECVLQGDLEEKVACVGDLVLGEDGLKIATALRKYFDQMLVSIGDLVTEVKQCHQDSVN